ncbi:hypothetical protein Micbo1qcDRAFT_197288 [Microdochium bolleyi]|uniref:C2H2-type domain-containing protein n=1 Tax=Microdochium bolleyi TaxID=196109 RepID=A0A136IUB2_9PEZI|nr:hypothetical protein Micbo1qcDRAFT_197288 [Microdochium bolleyi]
MDLAKTRMGLAKRLEESRGLRARAPIAAHYEDCSQAVQRLSESLLVHDSDSDLHRLARDCAIRLHIWGHGSGASSRGLDYSLKDCPGVRQHTLSLLEDLHESVDLATSEARLMTRGDTNPASSGYLEDSMTGAPLDDEFDLQSDPFLYLEEAVDILRNLFKLLPTLQNPLGENHGFGSNQDPFTHTEEEFQQLAMMMFPKMHRTLARRFGHGNWCRRRYIWRLSGGNLGSMASGPLKPGNPNEWEKHLRRQSDGQTKAPPSSIAVESDAGASTVISSPDTLVTVRAINEHDSATTITDSSQQSLLQPVPVPEPPVLMPTTNPFGCPYCLSELPLTLSSTRFTAEDWDMHVYRDLKPYICTFGDCFEPRRLYNTRSDWFQHELNFHRSAVEWACCGCDVTYTSSGAFADHLKTAHPALSVQEIQALIQNCKRYKVDAEYDCRCTVCDTVCGTIDELELHLGAHQQAYAPATFLNKEIPSEDVEEGNNLIAEYIHGLPDPPEAHSEDMDDLGLGVLTSLNLSPPVHMSSHPLEKSSWPRYDRNSTKSVRSDEGHLADWRDKVVKHTPKGMGYAEQGLPKRYENFVGRDIDMNRIHVHLNLPGQICTVSGRGGVGKTGLAIEYLHKYKGEYSAVFWIEAETPGVCAEQFGAILSNLDASEKLSATEESRIFQTREYLTRTDRRWLIVFDNVPTWKSVARYVPRNLPHTQGSVLITARTALFPLVHRYQNQHAVQLEPWPLPHGRQFLMTSIHPEMALHKIEDHEDFPHAEQVLKVVGGLPLAISMIVGFVKVSKLTLQDFLDLWEEKEHITRKKRRNVDIGEADIDSTIDSLWTIGIREVRMNSRRLLDVMSFLDPERIQESLLVGDHQEEYLEWIAEPLSFKRMINELVGRRLISVKEGLRGPIYIIHRLLAAKILLDMDDYGFVDAFRKIFRLIRKRFPVADRQQVPNSRNWPTCKEYIPHVFTLHRIFLQNKKNLTSLADPSPAEIASLFYDAGFYLWASQIASYDSHAFLRTAEEILQAAGVDFEPTIQANIHCIMGMLLLNMGVMERREGLRRLKAAYGIRRKIFTQDPTHNNDVLVQNAANDYALCLLNEHKFEQAGELFLKCRKRYLIWGEEESNPFENSKYYGNYALVHMWRGDMERAIQFQKRSIELIEKFSGRTNSYWRKVFMLACILLQNDDMQNALNVFLEVLTARLDILGQHHTETILATYAVGATYGHIGDPYTAIEYMQQCIDRVKRAKWDQAAHARAQYHLARLYRKQGIKEEEAAELEASAESVLEQYGQYAAECVQKQGNKMMILNDLQPTFLGRFTGLKLLKFLQENMGAEGDEGDDATKVS